MLFKKCMDKNHNRGQRQDNFAQRTCPECGENFSYGTDHRIYCSAECRLKHKANKAAEKAQSHAIKKICTVCGIEFETGDKRKITCSQKCAAERKNALRRKPDSKPRKRIPAPKCAKTLLKKVCSVCGKEFETYLKNQSYCSQECCKEFWRRRARDSYRQNKQQSQKELQLSKVQIAQRDRLKQKMLQHRMEANLNA